MTSYMSANTSDLHSVSDEQSVNREKMTTHLMVVSHFVQKNTLGKLLGPSLKGQSRYGKLSLAYQGYISLLAEKDYSPGELAEKLGISKQACSKTIKELEKLGLIARRPNPEDSRSSILTLTDKGLELLQEGIAAASDSLQQFVDSVGQECIEQLVAILEKLCRGFGIEIKSYPVLESATRTNISGKPIRLNMLLATLDNAFRQRLHKTLSNKGFEGLKPNFGQVLGLINREGQCIQYIASIIGASKQAIAVMASELENQGYITREIDPADKRQVILKVSPLGRQLLNEAVASVDELEAAMRDMISPEEFELLESTLETFYFQVAGHFHTVSVLPAKIQQLSEYLLEELGPAGARTLARQLMTITRGKS